MISLKFMQLCNILYTHQRGELVGKVYQGFPLFFN